MVRFRSGENASVWISPVKCVDFKPEKDVKGNVIRGAGYYETDDPAVIEALQAMGYSPEVLSKEELDALSNEEKSKAQQLEDIVKSMSGKGVDTISKLVKKVKGLKGGKAEEEPVVVEDPESGDFKCDICGKEVGNAGALAVHMKTHTEE